MSSQLRIAISGLVATYPFGGVFWDYMQYVLGLSRLGHDVLYIEDTGEWCYHPTDQTFVPGGETNAQKLATAIRTLDESLASRWFFRDSTGETFGRSWPDVVDFCGSADLFLHVSGSCLMRDEYFEAQKTVFIDSDPIYTQASVLNSVGDAPDEEERFRADMMERHDVFFTFGENVGTAGCNIPTEGFSWMPTRQPIVLDCFGPFDVPVDSRRSSFTTVASWEPTEKGPEVDGTSYSGKSVEFERFISLPSRVSSPLEIALSGSAPREELEANGWRLRNGYEVSHNPWVYRDYLARSLGEWSVAKNAYVDSGSGWFSCRTACYLALGVPAVVQDTGFSRHIPTGEGLIAFQTVEEAAAGIETIARDPARHARPARDLANAYFDSARVLSSLIERATASSHTDSSDSTTSDDHENPRSRLV